MFGELLALGEGEHQLRGKVDAGGVWVFEYLLVGPVWMLITYDSPLPCEGYPTPSDTHWPIATEPSNPQHNLKEPI